MHAEGYTFWEGRVMSMNRQEMNQKALDIMREEKRTQGVISTAGILDRTAAILTAVEVDRKHIRACVSKALNSATGNPLNTILGLIGLRVIRKDADIKIFEREDTNNELDSILKIDEKALRPIASQIASDLAAYEKEVDEDRTNKINKLNDMAAKIDEQGQNIRQLKADAKSQLQAVADRIQYMLCILGPDESDNILAEQLRELMTDLEIEAFWTAEGAPFSEAAMFVEVKTAEAEKHKSKPCLVRKGEVLAKGLRVCREETAKES